MFAYAKVFEEMHKVFYGGQHYCSKVPINLSHVFILVRNVIYDIEIKFVERKLRSKRYHRECN